MDSLVEKAGIPGCEISVYHKHKPIERYTAGWPDRENEIPISGNDLYIMYSATKVITCAAALSLYENGGFLMTDELSEYLPEFKDMTILTADGRYIKAENKIRMQDLFTMSAGLTYNLDTVPIKKLRESTGGRCPTRDIARAIAESPLVFEPGTHWNYSLCHDILGAVIEVISGKKFGDYIKEKITEPCGMKDTGFVIKKGSENRLACQYRYDYDKKYAERIPNDNVYRLGSEYESGGAGLISTVDDYMLFAEAMCSGGTTQYGERILSPKTIDLMRTNHLDAIRLGDFNWIQMKGYGYGLGVRTMIDPAAGGALSSPGEFGWGGAAGAYVLIDPEEELSIVYGQHMLNNLEPYVHPRLRNIIYTSLR